MSAARCLSWWAGPYTGGMSARTGYSISKPTGTCAASGRAMVVGEEFVATLVERGDGFGREDFSLEAWESGSRPKGRMVGFWRSVVASEDARAKRLIAGDELMDLFEQLEGTEDTSRLAFRYVLTLILIRKKLLLYEGTREGMVLVRARGVALPPEGPELVEVVDPGMTDERIQEVSEQLSAVIDEDGA